MVRGCLLPLGLWWGLWALYSWQLSPLMDVTACFLVGGFVSLMVVGFLGAIVEGWNAGRCRRAISRALRQEPLIDGQLTAVIGEILPVDEPARTPFSNEACVLCEYSIKRPRDESDSSPSTQQRPHFGVDVSGHIMNPCFIRSSQGDLRLIGFPQADGFDCEYPMLPSHIRAARELIAAGEFDSVGLRIFRLASLLTATYADEDGYVRSKFQIRRDPLSMFAGTESFEQLPDDVVRKVFDMVGSVDDDELDDDELDDDELDDGKELEDDDETSDDSESSGEDDLATRIRELQERMPKLAETVVPVGARVCAVGVYSAERQMLAPRLRVSSDYTRLYAGNPRDVETQLRALSRQKLLGGTIAVIVIHAILIPAIILGTRAKEREKQAGAIEDAGPVVTTNASNV